MGAGPVIREVRRTDAAALAAMHHQAWIDTYGGVLRPDYFDDWTVADVTAMWEQLLQAPAEAATRRRVAVEAAAVVGFAVAGPARVVEGRPRGVRAAELHGLYVSRSHLGTGLGQRLLDEVLPAAVPAELWVHEGNARARAFYEHNGFRPDGAKFTDLRFPELLELRMVR